MVKNGGVSADEKPFQHLLAFLAYFMQKIIARKCCPMVKNGGVSADEEPFQHFLAFLGHFM